jgi:multidrug transporter EmrE-like cation transporter
VRLFRGGDTLRLIAFWALFLTLDTATQMAFKATSEAVEGMDFGLGFLEAALATPALWVTILCYIGTFIAWMAVLMRMDLNRAFPLTALSFVTVPILARVLFGEELPPMRVAGIAVIIAGVFMIGWER